MSKTYGVSKSPNEVIDFINHQIGVNLSNIEKGKPKYTICIWGEKGIGKTEIVKQLKQNEKIKYVIPIALSQIEEAGDILGIPHKVQDEDGKWVTITAPPNWVPTVNEVGILLFDDFNRAEVRIIREFMQLLQDGTTLNWSLPPKWTIILTANPEEGDYMVAQLDPAMLTRMTHITMVTNEKDWLIWAEKNDADKRVMSFIAKHNQELNPGGRTCPRTWCMFGDMIRDIDNLAKNIDLVKTYGSSVLEDESINVFIKFVTSELEDLVEPQLICDHYLTNDKVRNKVLAPIKDGRDDVVNMIFNRLLAYLANKKIAPGSTISKNVLALFEEEALSKEVKYLFHREIHDATGKTGWFTSLKLAEQINTVI